MAQKKNSAPPKNSSKHLEPQSKKTKKSNDDVGDDEMMMIKRSETSTELFSLDVLMVIGSFAETIDLVRSMALVCRDWNQAVLNDGVFSAVFGRDFGDAQWFVDKINYNLSVDLMAPFAIKAKKEKENDEDEDDDYSNCDDREVPNRPVPNPSADKLTLSEIREILESGFGKGKFWYSLYRLVIAFIPIQCPKLITENEIVIPLNKGTKKKITKKKKSKKNTKKKAPPKKDSDEEDYLKKDVIHRVLSEDDDDSDFEKKISSNYYYFTLGLQEMTDSMENVALASRLIPALEYDLSTYKLGIILSLFDRHGLILNYFGQNLSHQECLNKITKEYKEHQKRVLNYNFSECTRSDVGALPRTPYIEILTSFQIGYDTADSHPCSILQFCYAILCGKETELFKGTRRKPKKLSTFDDDYELNNMIGVGPNTEDKFMPYCSYEIIEKPRFDEYSFGVSKIMIEVDPRNLHSKFISSFPGWARSFWNANFYFFHVVEFETFVRDFNDSDILMVAQNQNQILHNLC
ncbi:predicted protein [Naegleria gruberi]|uniref:Predicted protein n=1 Tax=Naegleria gruberi TaxID=5762 RepID=D2VZV7_NAEGR|nr:uncharacterized protein NAEGRDRAFT_74633 [Naegleria gruberi]EFC37638.1 predicted protein [Naegleria gruberi]|eukprot:XP_002670382.1 predicted protein [Naegleria gruberi strain NEG-M]